MKNKIKRIALCVGLIALGIVWMTGCGGDGGGSGSDVGGSTSIAPVVESVRFSTPSPFWEGTPSFDFNGDAYYGNQGATTVNLKPSYPVDYFDFDSQLGFWLQVNISNTEISHYDWEIVDGPDVGYPSLYQYDESISSYKKRTYSNRILYCMRELIFMYEEQPFPQMEVRVTAFTPAGKFATATFFIDVNRIDHADGPTSSKELPFDAMSAGEINPIGDVDWFYMEPLQAKEISIRAVGMKYGSSSTYRWIRVTVFDSDKTTSLATKDLYSTSIPLQFVPEAGQRYYLKVECDPSNPWEDVYHYDIRWWHTITL